MTRKRPLEDLLALLTSDTTGAIEWDGQRVTMRVKVRDLNYGSVIPLKHHLDMEVPATMLIAALRAKVEEEA